MLLKVYLLWQRKLLNWLRKINKMNEKPLVDKEYLLEKFPGKGGWTFTFIPEIPPDKHSPFGFFKVRGSIDGYEIKQIGRASCRERV